MTFLSLGFLTPEEGTDWFSRNVGKILPVTDSSEIFQEVFYFENSDISSSLRRGTSTVSGSYSKSRSGQ